jgi:DNA-3-methyladenine glycosylase I
MIERCAWVNLEDELYVDYHDREWGVPVHDDQILFEFIVLESFQAGLSWRIVLRKREAFRQAFANFDPEIVAGFDEDKVMKLLENQAIIRNRLKVRAAVTNAQAFMKIKEEFGNFDIYMWEFVGHKTITNHWKIISEIPSRTPESDAMSKDLIHRGFKFVGSTICYAHMQATGMVNDHTMNCFRYPEILQLS